MANMILTKSTKDGRTVEIREGRRYLDSWLADVYVAGSRIDSNVVPEALRPADRPAPEYTHHIGKVVLTADEAATVKAALEALDAADPEVQALALRSERRMLAEEISALLDDQQALREDWMDRGAVGPMPEYSTPEITAAREALRAFDAAHPEVIASSKSAKADMAKRHLWD